jgi:hypothetical protein
MKEATGELTGSVIVVSAVAVLTVFFFTFLWPRVIRKGLVDDATCANAVCDRGYNSNHMATCRHPEREEYFECPFRG